MESERTHIIAHAVKVRRITATALIRAMGLSGYCEMCGDATRHVAFWNNDRYYAQTCVACLGDANRHAGDENRVTR